MSASQSSQGPSMADVVAGLTARIDVLAAELLPGGRRDGHEFKAGSLAGEAGRSLSVCLTGHRAGVWCDFARPDERGDALDLVAGVLFQGDKKQAFAWAVSWLGLDHRNPARLRQTRRAVESKAARDRRQSDGGDTAKAGRKLWFDARADLFGTPVEAYLAHRGIGLDALGRVPGALRYGAAIKHKQTGRTHPAMLAAITNAAGRLISCHRTYLQRRGDHTDKLGGVADAKLTLGRYRGGAIRLWRGLIPDPDTGEIKPALPLAEAIEHARTGKGAAVALTLCEGIEDGLTLALADPARRIWTGVSQANLASVDLPEGLGQLIIAQDNDTDRDAIRGWERVWRAYRDRGIPVSIIRPPDGVKDFNDLLRGVA